MEKSGLNVLGFLSKRNALQAYSCLGSVNSDVVIRCINDFCKDLDKKTVLVMDNAPIHTSETFQKNIPYGSSKFGDKSEIALSSGDE